MEGLISYPHIATIFNMLIFGKRPFSIMYGKYLMYPLLLCIYYKVFIVYLIISPIYLYPYIPTYTPIYPCIPLYNHVCLIYPCIQLYILLLYGGECFTGNLTTRRFHTPLHPGPEWRIFRMSPLRVSYRSMTSRFPPFSFPPFFIKLSRICKT